jgi:hypothetical protein
VNSVLVCHNMFWNVYQGSIPVLYDAITLTAHMTAVHLRRNIHYTPIGPWPHCSSQ